MTHRPICEDFHIIRKYIKDRIIFLGMPIDEVVANAVMLAMDELDQDSQRDITLYINSPGGIVSAAFSVMMKMKSIKSEVCTVNIGQANGMAAYILAFGATGKRFCLSKTTVLLSRFQQYNQKLPIEKSDAIESMLFDHTQLTRDEYEKRCGVPMNDHMQQKVGIVDRIIIKPK